MKTKGKAGGKNKVTFDARKPAKMPFQQFSFEPWTDDDFHPPLVTMASKIAEFEETARRETIWSLEAKEKGDEGEAGYYAKEAKTNRAKAKEWDKIRQLSEKDAERRDLERIHDVREGVDYLLARSEQNDWAMVNLALIIDQSLRGLHAMAAHGKEAAATMLIDRLLNGVTSFKFLALHRPELFTHYTRRVALIPATISPQRGSAKVCDELIRKLEVGTESIFSVAAKGRRWRESSPAISLALRLVTYIDGCRSQSQMPVGYLALFETCPPWFPPLAYVRDFGPASWPEWAEIAWEIIGSISPDGQAENHPAFRSCKTKICNVRNGSENYQSTARADIKEALCAAFETIATEQSPRTRQRKAKATRQTK